MTNQGLRTIAALVALGLIAWAIIIMLIVSIVN
jgi:hypothetical protein